MRTIRISDEVWNVIAAHGKFLETENDVLEKLLQVYMAVQKSSPPEIDEQKPVDIQGKESKERHSFANIKMSAEVRGKFLHVSFENGPANKWSLPDCSDKHGIRKVRDVAVGFAKQNGASFGQEQAVKKALTNAGYWLLK